MVSAGRVELAGDAAVEVGVLVRGDLGLRLGPQRRAVGDLGGLGAGLVDDRDRHRHVAGLVLDDALKLEALGVGLGVLGEVQHHAGAAGRGLGELDRRHREGALAVGGPLPRLGRAGAAGDDVDLVRHHEGGIEADAELADQVGIALGGVEPLQERLGAGMGDGAERLDQLGLAHADAVVLERQAAGIGVDGEGDAGLGVVAEQVRLGDRLVAQPLAGIGGIGDQFAQEHVAVGIDRVHHHVQQLGDVGGKGPALAVGGCAGGLAGGRFARGHGNGILLKIGRPRDGKTIRQVQGARRVQAGGLRRGAVIEPCGRSSTA